MKKILVTGANGFIGQRLCAKLNQSGFSVAKVVRDTSNNELSAYTNEIDYCFHLAGEVNPKAGDGDFTHSNVTLTETLARCLTKNPVEVVLTSTVHASNPVNVYGATKKKSEDILIKYARESGVDCHIFRLPHMFGPGCKPNYNSVLTTWIVNAINGRDLVVYDSDITMSYIYVDDLIEMFLSQIGSEVTCCLPPAYSITLGELKELIQLIVSGKTIAREDEFTTKLRLTIEHYQNNKKIY